MVPGVAVRSRTLCQAVPSAAESKAPKNWPEADLAVSYGRTSEDLADMEAASRYVPLHVHSDFSLLDGASQLPKLVKRAKELGMPALALTDHGVMYGAVELVRLCKAEGIKPIIGNEMYIIHGDIHTKYAKGDALGQRYHLTVLAKNWEGYKNLVQLTTVSHLEGVQGVGMFARPCINRELLEKHREGLIVCSGCLSGEVPRALFEKDMDKARDTVDWYASVFGDDYYLEIMNHFRRNDENKSEKINDVVNAGIVQLAAEKGVKMVATNDSHFTLCGDFRAHEALIAIKRGKKLSEMDEEKRVFDEEIAQLSERTTKADGAATGEASEGGVAEEGGLRLATRKFYYTGEEYLKAGSDMIALFRASMGSGAARAAVATSGEIADKVAAYELFKEPQLPNYETPDGFDENEWLQAMAEKGLAKKFGGAEVPRTYLDRLALELGVIKKQGFSAYFLVVGDIINNARENGIPVGPGRGSAAGSLVAYALSIIGIDPVKYGLLFERFLNEERRSLPDIDSDFCWQRRDEVLKYISQHFGEERVAQIVTFNRLTSRAVLKDVARVLEISYAEATRLAKLVPVVRGKSAKLQTLIDPDSPSPEFYRYYNEHVGQGREWVDLAMKLEGTHKTFGVHAAGVVIAPQSFPLREVVPLQRSLGSSHGIVTQYAMDDIEALGFLKFDILGLKNLTSIARCYALVESHYGIKLPPMEELPVDDQDTFALLTSGRVEGVFQLEASTGMRKVVTELKPSRLEDLFAIVALYRPGPLDAGLVDKYIRRKHNLEPVVYETPELEPILEETYGVLLYQEQIMQMARQLAGYSLGQADVLRRAMGKKKPEEMQAQREKFVEGAVARGVARHVADDLFKQMVDFAEYCFNKSHSAAYGYITYVTAYLKARYPVAHMAALLSCSLGRADDLRRYLAACPPLGIAIEPPNVNASGADFTIARIGKAEGSTLGTFGGQHGGPEGVCGELGSITFGLEAVKDVGEAAVQGLLEVRGEGAALRPFHSLPDLVARINPRKVNKRCLVALAKAGALDSLDPGSWGAAAGSPGGEEGRSLVDRARLAEVVEKVWAWRQKRDRAAVSSEKRREREKVKLEKLQALLAAWELEQALEQEQGEGKVTKKSRKPSPIKALKGAEGAADGEERSEEELQEAAVAEEVRKLEEAAEQRAARPAMLVLQDNLRMEKEFLGFYVSGHPLDPLVGDGGAAAWLQPTPLAEVQELGNGAAVCVVALVEEVAVKATKKDRKPYAQVVLEDASGTLPAWLWPPAFAALGSKVKPAAQVLVWGTLKVEAPNTGSDSDSESSDADVSTDSTDVSVEPGAAQPKKGTRIGPRQRARAEIIVKGLADIQEGKFLRVELSETHVDAARLAELQAILKACGSSPPGASTASRSRAGNSQIFASSPVQGVLSELYQRRQGPEGEGGDSTGGPGKLDSDRAEGAFDGDETLCFAPAFNVADVDKAAFQLCKRGFVASARSFLPSSESSGTSGAEGLGSSQARLAGGEAGKSYLDNASEPAEGAPKAENVVEEVMRLIPAASGAT